MSVRLSDGLPARLLRAHVGGRPRITPAIVACSDNVGDMRRARGRRGRVGSIAFARPKSSTFTVPSSRTLMFAGFEIAVDDPLLVRGFERLGDLLGDRQRLERSGMAPRAIRSASVGALDQLHHERVDAVRFLEAVNVRDVRMVQRREDLRLALEAREALRIASRTTSGRTLIATSRFELRVARAIDLAHPAGAERAEDFVRAEASAGLQGHWLRLGASIAARHPENRENAADPAPGPEGFCRFRGSSNGRLSSLNRNLSEGPTQQLSASRLERKHEWQIYRIQDI